MHRFLLLLFFTTSLFADEPTLHVKLATQSRLSPLYLDFRGEGNFAKKISEILNFDLNHNGFTQIIPESKERKELATSEALDSPIHAEKWTALNVQYLFRVQVKEQTLTAKVYDLVHKEQKDFTLELSENIDHSREQLHHFSDQLTEMLFGTPSVASLRIIYTITQGNDRFGKPLAEVWECDYDGGRKRKLTHDQSLAVTPSYIPASAHHRPGSFVYVSYQTGQPKIWHLSKNTQGPRTRGQMSSLGGNQFMPKINLQRNQLAFVCDRDGNPDIFLQKLNLDRGTAEAPKRLFKGQRGAQGSPCFSPDGKRLAFVSNKDGFARIYIADISKSMPLDEDDVVLITKKNRENTSPSWSPDGTKIAYSSKNGPVRQVYIYDIETGRETQLTHNNENKENPCFAPNSHHLIYNSQSANSSELYFTNLYHPSPTRIPAGSGKKAFASFEPIQK